MQQQSLEKDGYLWRWFYMKYAYVRMLEQLDNLYEHFLTFLLRQKNFKWKILYTIRYRRIKAASENITTQVYFSFCSYAVQDFESFLQLSQANEPMIQMLYSKICKLLSDQISEFIRKNEIFYLKIFRKILKLILEGRQL